MDIKQAKEDIRRTFLAYTERSADGLLRIPTVRQRPVLLMGPPGLGKTAIVWQLAQELGAGFVAYTMTHHTRQSALGLPLIREKVCGGKTYQATEYTMSEILAAVYDQMEKTGQTTGILFLDEINCVSETLMPAMLQLLQSKRFGTHQLPEGWLIVAAGNPPQYNASARLFDAVTMDRVKLLNIEENFSVWQSYAHARGLHPAILAYLEQNSEHFYCVQPHAHGKSFVTARAWEDLSEILYSYARLGFPVEQTLFGEYLQHEEIAASFAAFFQLSSACARMMDIPSILAGNDCFCAPELRALRFDGRLAAAEFLLHALSKELRQWRSDHTFSESLSSFLRAVQNAPEPLAAAREQLARREQAMQVKKDCGVLLPEEEAAERLFSRRVHALTDGAADLSALTEEDTARRASQSASGALLTSHLENAMQFLQETFGPGHELLVFLTQLSALPDAKRFLRESAIYTALLQQTTPEELAKHL